MQELYRSGRRQIGRPEFYKPYLEIIDKENPYLRGYKIIDLSLFFGEDGQSTLEHVSRFTCNVGNWLITRISIISSLDRFLTL